MESIDLDALTDSFPMQSPEIKKSPTPPLQLVEEVLIKDESPDVILTKITPPAWQQEENQVRVLCSS